MIGGTNGGIIRSPIRAMVLTDSVRYAWANREIVLGNALLSTQSHPVTRRSENPNTGGLEVIDISSRDKMLFRGPSLASPLILTPGQSGTFQPARPLDSEMSGEPRSPVIFSINMQ
jgi:hypothetical protein